MGLLLSDAEQAQIIDAIKAAEMATSGEIRVHIEHHCPTAEPIHRAIEIFGQLGMHRTKLKNGVLFYVAVEDRKFAVIGDKGINERVPEGFWDTVRDHVRSQFIHQKYAEGLNMGIREAGEQLQKYFPRQHDDTNELTDDISFG